MSNASDPIAKAKAQIAERRSQREQLYAETRFDRCTPAELVQIAVTKRDLEGRPLRDGADIMALDTAWYFTFGESLCEPAGDDDGEHSATETPADAPLDQHAILSIPDDAMLRPRDIRRLFGYARSTLKRHVKAGKFPRPLQTVPGERSIGWPARQLKVWFLDASVNDGKRH